MPKQGKRCISTDKIALINTVQDYINKGKKAMEISDLTGKSLSYIQKISAKLNMPTKVDSVITELMNNPYMDLTEFGLSDSQKDMIWRYKSWLTYVKPKRVIAEFLNNPRLDYEKDIRKLNEDTLDALELMPEWEIALTARQEFKKFKLRLKQMREELDQIEETTKMYTPKGNYNLEQLKGIRDSIPVEDRSELSKSATKRLAVQPTVAIMHDFEYVQVLNNIRILEHEILVARLRIIKRYMDGLGNEARTLVLIYLGNPLLTELPAAQIDTRIFVDAAGVLDDYSLPKCRIKMDIKEEYWTEEQMEKANRDFVAS